MKEGPLRLRSVRRGIETERFCSFDMWSLLAAKHKLPAIYLFGYFVKAGGLVSYGRDLLDEYRRAVGDDRDGLPQTRSPRRSIRHSERGECLYGALDLVGILQVDRAYRLDFGKLTNSGSHHGIPENRDSPQPKRRTLSAAYSLLSDRAV